MKNSKYDGARVLGRAAEHRVLAELLLNGHKPYVVEVDNGIDMILENGKKIQIKASTLKNYKTNGKYYKRYMFTTRRRYSNGYTNGYMRAPKLNEKIDFVICWGVEDDLFYILPKNKLPKGDISIYPPIETKDRKYDNFKNNWKILEES